MKLSFTMLILLWSFSAAASNITLPAKPVIGINAAELAKRVCYYQDHAYSQGAILQVGEHYLTCEPANNFETHGVLQWVPFEDSKTDTSNPKHTQEQLKRYQVN